MKISVILNVLLAAALIVLAVKLFGNKQDASSDSQSVVMDNILTRTSIRAYQDKPIEDEKIEQMLRAAMAAPSAGNKQPWRFIVIKDKTTLKAISDSFHTMSMAQNAPLAIVVCGDLKATFPEDGLDYWVEDTSAATENLLLAAHSLGLGAVWCGIYPMQQRVAQLRKMLNIPKDIIPLNVVPIGYPAEQPAPKDKWNDSEIHYETWNGAPASLQE